MSLALVLKYLATVVKVLYTSLMMKNDGNCPLQTRDPSLLGLHTKDVSFEEI